MSDLKLALNVPTHLNPRNLRVRIMGTWDKPWFHLGDVCEVLGIKNTGNVAARLKDGEKFSIRLVDVNRGTPYATFVSEGAFYKTVMRSDKPQAEAFSDWVTDDVLPSIRKFGCYPPPKHPKPDLLPYTHRVLRAVAVEQSVPEGYWCVFAESSRVLIMAEQVLVPAGFTLDVEDLLDGSIGRRWSQHREGKSWAGERASYPYQFPPPSKRCQIVVYPHAYPDSELIHFREFLKREYLPKHFHQYLQMKYGVSGFTAVLPHIRRVMPSALPPSGR